MSERLAKKLLIVGWDAADWKIIDALFAKEEMPNLRRLVDRGVRANLATLEPRLSPLLWTTIATGKTADKHGILNFIEPNPSAGGVRISSSTSRKTKALWNILTLSGLRTNVVSWYASHPAEPINGVCVSNLFQEGAPEGARDSWPIQEGAVHPAEWAERIARQRLHPAQVSDAMLRSMIPRIEKVNRSDSRLTELRKLVAHCHSVHRAVITCLKDDSRWDCAMVFYDAIDTIGHHFMEFHPPRMAHVSEADFVLFQDVMSGVYRMQDDLLGDLLKAAGHDVTVMLLSDHGFHSDELRPKPVTLSAEERQAVEAAWHRPFGVLVLAGPSIKHVDPADQPVSPGLLDIAPTALALLGLPRGRDMPGRTLTEVFDRTATLESHASWDDVAGEAGLHPADLRQDPFESHDAVQQLVDLGYLAELPADTKTLVDLTRRETQFNRAVVYMTTGRASLAIPVLETLVRERPAESRYVIALAQCLFKDLRWDECATLLKPFIDRRPDSVEARLMLAAALGSAGNQAHAVEELRAVEALAATKNQSGTSVSTMLGDAYSVIRNWNEAERHYQAVLKQDPSNPHVLHGLARSALAQRRFEQAIDFCLTALEIQHAFPEAHHLLGVALAWIEDSPHAIQSFQVAISMQPGLLDAHRFLSLLLERAGDSESARHHQDIVNRLLKGYPSSAVIPEAPMGPDEWVRQQGASQAKTDATR